MVYQEFLNAVMEGVKKIAGEEAEVLIHQVTKNNGIVLDGLVVMEGGKRFSPTIYLNEYYSEYLEAGDIDEIAGKVYRLYLENCNNIVLPEAFFLNFEELKGQIAFRLVSFEQNRRLLEQIPYRRWKDLAIVYFVVCDNLDKERAVVTIYNNHLELWNVGEEELYRLAADNTPRLYKAQICPMNQVISDMILKESEHEENVEELISNVNRMNEEFPMYVLTNEMKNYGAACMLYNGLLQDFTRRIQADIYIIPSSIHEVILIPVDEDISRESLVDMVQNVNKEELSREEILSDTVYFYSREKGFE